MCKHPRAELLDAGEMLYRCGECNSSNKIVKVVPTVTTKKESPKMVSISPKKDKPEGFKL
jgi:hypothetical protein